MAKHCIAQARLVEALRWALHELADGKSLDDGPPPHECEYTTDPERGGCRWKRA